MENVFDVLEQRGLIKQSIYTEELRELLGTQPVVCYMGFDPTAPSLHIGSLAAILFLRRMQMYGHTPIALVGGATGSIGATIGCSTTLSTAGCSSTTGATTGVTSTCC